LLPSTWHSIAPVEKQKVVSIVESHGAQFTVEICKALYIECIIHYKEQNSLLVCYDLAKTHPEQLLMMDPPRYHVIHNEDDDILMTEADAGVERSAYGLNMFMLKTKDLNGKSLFNHICLDVEHSEAQVEEFGSGAKYLQMCSIMRYAHDDGVMMKFVAWKLDNLGCVKSHGGMQNDPERLHRLTNRVEFSQSLAAIAVLEHQDAVQVKVALVEELRTMAPAAKIKLLQNNNDVSKLTKKEILSLLLTWFVVKENRNKK
jgi:hypothetical protein